MTMTASDPPTTRTCLAIVLAAGEGTRMTSAATKSLHRIGGLSLLGHVLGNLSGAGADAVAVVVGPDHGSVAAEARRIIPDAEIFVQGERLGTAHAVLAARPAIARGYDDVLVVFADTPLVRPQTFLRMRRELIRGVAVVVLGFEALDSTGYGRLIVVGGGLHAIREHKDASEAERALHLCNAGLMALAGRNALAILEGIGNANAQEEYYLTDAVSVAHELGLEAVPLIAGEDEVMGINDRVQLAAAEAVLQRRLREAAMRNGATLIAPETVFLSHDTVLGRDVTVEPNVVFGPRVRVGEGAVIHAFSHLEEANIGPGASIGPFARLRPGANVGAKAKIGNFVEIKNADVEAGAKVNHLSYIGDARVGAGSNIGAGTITCNYDGANKFHTDIGAGAFVGSNSALIAPVAIGDGAYIGSGSVITDDVPADALAVARGRQYVKEGWAKSRRKASASEAADAPGKRKGKVS
ncbi:MAG: bifunctional UDP-N-acetylglucosamine diphosphorylase/glucosamine-1-phosphate N-acetyltransferase GlmU [Methylobacteriaceae bacterium]|nr:bifunctional UDP-N-acetylglucosamine diphosphorylase/glucosamine-1-phosphate N-acetyltransferase GlmU [Methylobacteriaceae bacterium]